MASFSTGKNSTSVEYNSNSNSSYIKRLLKNYLASADRSLSGPDRAARVAAKNSAASEMLQGDSPASTEPTSPVTPPTQTTFTPLKVTDPSSVVFRLPVFLTKDNSAASQRKADTLVRGQTVACFDVGGEKRICVPALLNTVLRDVTIDDINVACDELCVYCSQCSDEQMAALKSAGVLPESTLSAGLMTKSQAERLCHYLFEKKFGAGPPGLALHRLETASGFAFKVYHECFGKCKGIFYADRYVKPNAACIECCQCSCLMSPADFVCHGHRGQELRTCHWGFDSAKWRAYLLVARDHRDDIEALQAKLEELKFRFRDKELSGCGPATSPASAPLTLTVNLKRKDVSQDNIPTTPVPKRVRLDSAPSSASSATLTSDILQLLVQQERSHHHHGNDAHTRHGWASSRMQTPPQPIKLKREVTDRTEAAASSDVDHTPVPVLAAGGRLFGSHGNVSNLHAQHQQQQQQQAVSSNADRRQLVEMLRLITSGEGVPTSTRQRLADSVLGLFDQRHHVISRLVQENGHLASKLQLATSLETKYRAALADLEGAEGLAALSSPRTASLPSHAPTFTFPCTPDEASAAAAADITA